MRRHTSLSGFNGLLSVTSEWLFFKFLPFRASKAKNKANQINSTTVNITLRTIVSNPGFRILLPPRHLFHSGCHQLTPVTGTFSTSCCLLHPGRLWFERHHRSLLLHRREECRCVSWDPTRCSNCYPLCPSQTCRSALLCNLLVMYEL